MKHPNVDEISLIYPNVYTFIQERAIQYLDFVAIQQFHPPKKGEFISKYSFEIFLITFELNIAQKKTLANC
jgi:hypothetical protein